LEGYTNTFWGFCDWVCTTVYVPIAVAQQRVPPRVPGRDLNQEPSCRQVG
jgi:hypothetical protein